VENPLKNAMQRKKDNGPYKLSSPKPSQKFLA
jgi:hypothetical protein